MNGLILLIVFILIFINIVRAILKGSQNREEGTGEKGAQEEGLLLNFLSARARNEAWMEAAGKLDLQYVRPANLRARPALRGIRKELVTEAHIEYSPSGSLTTVCSVQFPEKLGIGLLILREDAAVVTEEFAGRRTLRVTALEGTEVRCSAQSAEALKEFLTDSRINALKNALSFYRTLKVTDDYVVLKMAGECQEADLLTSLIEFTVSLASILCAKSASEPVRGKSSAESAEEALPGLRTVVALPASASAVPEFRRPKTVTAPIPPAFGELDGEEEASRSPLPPAPEKRGDSSVLPRPAEISSDSMARPADLPEGKTMPSAVSEPAPSASSETLLEQNTLAAALFAASFPGAKEQALFQTVKGKRIEWSGILKSSYRFGNDFVLGNGPAVKAVFEIAELTGNYSMKTRVKAVIRLPQEALDLLKNRNGERFRFTGTLEKFEAFAREIVILDGSLLS